LGELLDGNTETIARSWRASGFQAMFDFPFAFAVTDVFCKDAPLSKLGVALTADRFYPDPGLAVTLVDNHDLPRLAFQCGGSEERIRRALSYLLASRGIPSIIWGTEVGLSGEKDPFNRESMNFDEKNPLRAHVRAALSNRKRRPSLSTGASRIVHFSDDALIVARFAKQEASLVSINRGLPFEFDAPWGARVPIPSGVSTVSEAGDFATSFASFDAQWRTGQTRRTALFKGPKGMKVVGSSPELGGWEVKKALALPARVALPLGGVFEFKLIRTRGDGAVEFESRANRSLFVSDDREEFVVELLWEN
jgi:hypothetical protein